MTQNDNFVMSSFKWSLPINLIEYSVFPGMTEFNIVIDKMKGTGLELFIAVAIESEVKGGMCMSLAPYCIPIVNKLKCQFVALQIFLCYKNHMSNGVISFWSMNKYMLLTNVQHWHDNKRFHSYNSKAELEWNFLKTELQINCNLKWVNENEWMKYILMNGLY